MEKLSKIASSIINFLSSPQPYQTIAAFGFGILLGIIPNWVVAGGTYIVVEERDIEFIGTHYDENGKPDGSLIPIIFSFKPQSRLEST